jgi:preprotein translocase subunit SecD
VPPRTTQTSQPWRYLAALAALLIVMLVGILGTYTFEPGNWHKGFKVGLGLDLSSGTTVLLKAVTPHGQPPTAAEMTEAKNIMTNRVNGAGFNGASVQTSGTNQIAVSVPGKGAQQVVGLVGQTALLRFRQVLLVAPNYTTSSPTSNPSPSPSGSPSTSPSTSPSSSAGAHSTSPSPSTSTSSKASAAGHGQAVGAVQMHAAAATPSPTASGSASPSTSPSGSASPSPSSSGKQVLATTADGIGDATMVNSATVKLFNKLNCADKNWQAQIYGSANNAAAWDDPSKQIVACNGGLKYALATAPVTGTELTSASAGTSTNEPGWIVQFKMNSQGASALGKLTSTLYTKYYSTNPSPGEPAYYLSQMAVVLDGNIVSAPQVQSVITSQGQITGGSSGFSQGQATKLANVLEYGHLPLSFQKESISAVSPQLGSSQLSAGLIAAAVGLFLVVLYSFLYYRGLGLVSVSSLAIAAAVTYMAVVLLSKFESFALSLAGIAGLVVAVGITADSFVVFFERLRDEVREGRSLRAAVERGWTRARRTILVSDTVSFIAAALLYFFAIGDVKNFAFTLGLTTIIDVVVVFLFTKPMITLLARTKFYGQGHKLSGLDPARLGMRSPWRGRPGRAQPAGGAAMTTRTSTSPKEA